MMGTVILNTVATDREKFKQYMNSLMTFKDYLDKLDKLNISIWEEQSVADFEMMYVELLEKLLGVTVDKFGSDISYFLYDCERGKRGETCVFNKENNPHSLRNLDELYDWIVYCRNEKQ